MLWHIPLSSVKNGYLYSTTTSWVCVVASSSWTIAVTYILFEFPYAYAYVEAPQPSEGIVYFVSVSEEKR